MTHILCTLRRPRRQRATLRGPASGAQVIGKTGLAGAILQALGEGGQEQVERLSATGLRVAPVPSAMGEALARVLSLRVAT